ncbi:hypothetical protein KDA14_01730 [Candidatus Saccharibacteria bacterium]|nr:hypothetical protein [Candidatus Saccharibacteria bacterium]
MNTSRKSKSSLSSTYNTTWTVVGLLVAAVAVTGLILGSISLSKIHRNEDSWDDQWDGRHYTRVESDGTVRFTGDIVVQGNIEGMQRIDGIPFFSAEYQVCDGMSVQQGRAVSWFVADDADPAGCVASGFEGVPATPYAAHEDLGDPFVIRLVDHMHTIVLGYLCNDGASYCWKVANYDSDNSRYLPSLEHILDAGGVGVYSARLVSLENAEYFGVIATSDLPGNDLLFYICNVESGDCVDAGVASTYAGAAHYVTDAKSVGIATNGDLIVVAGLAIANNATYAYVYGLTPDATAGYLVSVISENELDPNIVDSSQTRDAVQVERLLPGTGIMRLLIGTGPVSSASDSDFNLHYATVSSVDGSAFGVVTSEPVFPLDDDEDFEYSLSVFPGTDNWIVAYNHVYDTNINNLLSGNVDALNAINVETHRSFAPDSYLPFYLQRGSEVEAITAESAIIVYRDTLDSYRPIALIVNVDASGAFVDFGDRVQLSTLHTNDYRVVRINQKRFVVTDTSRDSVGIMQVGRIYAGSVSESNAYDAHLHFGSVKKGRSVVGVATAAAGSGTMVDVLTAGVYCFPESVTLDALPFTQVGPIFASEDGTLSLSPIDSVSHMRVAQQVGKTVNARCAVVNVFAN